MKKSLFILSLLSLMICTTNTLYAWDSGCSSSGPYSSTTGHLCGERKAECNTSELFSALTGKPCNESQEVVSSSNNLSESSISKGTLWIAGSNNSFQITLANFTEGSTTLGIDYPSDLKPIGVTDLQCSGGICTDIQRFISADGTSRNAPSLSDNHLYEFTLKVFGEIYTVELAKEDEKTIFGNYSTQKKLSAPNLEEERTCGGYMGCASSPASA